MKKWIIAAIILLWSCFPAHAQIMGGGVMGGGGGTLESVPSTTVAGLPGPQLGVIRIVTDGVSGTDCTTGGGSTKVFCLGTGSAWAPGGAGAGLDAIPVTTVSGLPSAEVGWVRYVSNGNSATDCTVGGGSTKVACIYNGSAWTALGLAGASAVSDAPYDATGWNGDVSNAPSKNTIRDKIETLQPKTTNLAIYDGISPSENMQTFLAATDYANMRTLMGVAIGTNVQAANANLTTYAAIAPAPIVQSILACTTYPCVRALLDLEVGTDFNAYSANLATVSSPAAWRLFYSDGSGNITPVGFGNEGTVLTFHGASAAPTAEAAGAGDVLSVGNCTSGACLDGTSAGGTQISLYSSSGATLIKNNAGVVEARNALDTDYVPHKASGYQSSAGDGSRFVEVANTNDKSSPAEGECWYNKTSQTWNCQKAAGTMRYTNLQERCYTVKDPTASSDHNVGRFPLGITIYEATYLAIGGTNWVGQFQECDANGASCGDVQATDSTATSGTTTTVNSFSDNSIAASNVLKVKTTSVNGTPAEIMACIFFYIQ